MPELKPDARAGAIVEFVAMLTTLEKPITVGARHEAGEMVTLAAEFCAKRGWKVSQRWAEMGKGKSKRGKG